MATVNVLLQIINAEADQLIEAGATGLRALVRAASLRMGVAMDPRSFHVKM
jgi:hypothetical protein